ncbi:helix-turn-helix domain-containing protein [Eubacteriales bacterium KG125]
MELFAENLKRLRKERNMTQDQLAHVSDIPKGTICNYEQNRGGCDPSLHNLMVLADIFDVTPYNLYYGGKKEMTTNSIYMDEIVSELMLLNRDAIEEIQASEPNGISLPKLSITDEIISKLAECWNKNIVRSKRGLYKPYIEQTIYRYAQDRQGWKKKYGLD